MTTFLSQSKTRLSSLYAKAKDFYKSYRILYAYIAREFFLAFIVSFLFFFFIFFVNQLLLLLQNTSVQNLSVKVMLQLVILSIPQFLIYTFPFAALAGSSMVIGDLSSKNEILALRSSGISITHVFVPIVLISVLIAGAAFFTADVINPWSARQYKRMYSKIIEDMPSVVLKPYSVTEIGDINISVGEVDGNYLTDVVIVDATDPSEHRIVSAPRGSIDVLDRQNYVYEVSLYEPDIVFTSTGNLNNYSLSKAKEFRYALDLSSQLPSFGEPGPNQVNVERLNTVIASHKENQIEYEKQHEESLLNNHVQKAEAIAGVNDSTDFYEIVAEIMKVEEVADRYNNLTTYSMDDYQLRYYQSELHKRFALSLACLVLVFVAFPISFFKVNHGRLVGFGLSVFVAVVYWGVTYFTQLRAVLEDMVIWILMWAPNIFFLLLSLVFLYRLYKS